MDSREKRSYYILFFLAFIAAFLMADSLQSFFVLLILFSLLGLLLLLSYLMFWAEKIRTFIAFFRSKFFFMDKMVIFIAAVIKVDRNVSSKEVNAVQSFFHSKFSQEQATYLSDQLQKFVETDIDLKKALKSARYLPKKEKSNLIYMLVWIATTDRILTQKEERLIKYITVQLGFSIRTFYRNLRYFEYQKASEYYQQQQNPSAATPSKKSLLIAAYDLLEVTSSDPNKKIKKAYRKLAKMHHPDRAKYDKQAAKAKFQLITEAYDLIKLERGFV